MFDTYEIENRVFLFPIDAEGRGWDSVSARLDQESCATETIIEDSKKGIFYRIDICEEDIALEDSFDDTCHNIEKLRESVNLGDCWWVCVRIGCINAESGAYAFAYLGGVYVDAKDSSLLDFLSDGYLEDLIEESRDTLETIETERHNSRFSPCRVCQTDTRYRNNTGDAMCASCS